MGVIWITGAERLGDGSIGGAMDSPNLPGRAVEHTVECLPGRGYFLSMAAYLVRVATEPHILRDPQSDSLGQFGPLNRSARALKNAGSVRTNRTGEVCIQSEVCAYAAQPWTNGFTPADNPNYLRFIAAVDSWKIPRVWPAGPPPRYPAGSDDRDLATWLNRGGYFGHSQVPGNDHGDPGAIDISKCPPSNVINPPTLPVNPNVFPGTRYFGPGRSNAYVTRLGQMLVSRGGGRFYSVGPGPTWGEANRLATQAFQRAQGWTGADADGFPGPTTWGLLVNGLGKSIPGMTTPTPQPPRPIVPLREIVNAAKADPPAPDGHTTNYASVIIVENALADGGWLDRRYVDGSFGIKTVDAYAAFQRSLNLTGDDANGIPGMWSLTHLGNRFGFTVVER
jgi:hypothetical protein